MVDRVVMDLSCRVRLILEGNGKRVGAVESLPPRKLEEIAASVAARTGDVFRDPREKAVLLGLRVCVAPMPEEGVRLPRKTIWYRWSVDERVRGMRVYYALARYLVRPGGSAADAWQLAARLVVPRPASRGIQIDAYTSLQRFAPAWFIEKAFEIASEKRVLTA